MSSCIYKYSKSLTLCIRPFLPFYPLSVVELLVEAVEYYAVTLFKKRLFVPVDAADRPSTKQLAL
jgi:hypothetical protein